MQRELSPKVTEGLFFDKKAIVFTIPPSFSYENATSLYTREALDRFALFILLTVILKASFVSKLFSPFLKKSKKIEKK